MGEDCFKIISNLKLGDEKNNDPEELIKAIEENLAPEKNVIYNRVIFNEASQDVSEGAELYIDRLRGLIKLWECGQMDQQLLREKLMISTIYTELKTQFMSDKLLTLDKIIETIKSYESAQKQIKSLNSKSDNEDMR